jgi:DNA polymerase I
MDIATWNVNSIRSRLERVVDWLAHNRPDVLCLQELKVVEADFPFDALRKAGYFAAVSGQPTYNGVAVLSRTEPTEVRRGLDDDTDDPQARLVAAKVGGVWILSAYFPNGGEVGSDKWAYKLAWMRRLRTHLDRRHDPAEPLALCGDFNVAPDDLDVAFPATWAGSVLCHPDARAALAAVADWGLVDVVRRQLPQGGHYSWWDYQNLAFPRDDGLRIDHVFATAPLAERLAGAGIDRSAREGKGASDHTPVWARFAAPGTDASAGTKSGATPADAPARTPSRAGRTDQESPPVQDSRAKKLVLIDGHSVAYRAYYGLPLYDRRGAVTFSTKAGEFTNAVYGFANMLIKTWNDERPDYIAVAFDLGRTFRDELFDAYKATRAKMPDELSPQIERIVELVRAFDIPAVTAEGFEADDILGTLSKRAAREGLDVLIVTGDSDAFQLIEPRIRVLAPGRLWSDTAIHDEAAVLRRYGLTPAQLIDYKALVGDTSDNVPGVKGIGEKSAGPLLQRWGSLEAVYAHLDELEPARVQNALTAGRDMAFLSQRLVTIRTDVPLDISWDACAVHAYDRSRVEALFDVLEFRSIRNRLPAGGVSSAAPSGTGAAAAGSVDEAAGSDTTDATTSDATSSDATTSAATTTDPTTAAAPPAAAATARLPRGVPAQLAMFGATPAPAADPARRAVTETTVVTDEATLRAMVARLAAAEWIAFDVETTSTDPLRAVLVGIALAVETGAAWYVPVGHLGAEAQLPLEVVLDALRPVLSDPRRRKVAHNAKYDVAVLHLAGIDVQGLAYDTMLAEFLIDPGARLGLKALARSRLGVDMTEIAELIGTGKAQITMDRVPVADAAPYAAADVDMTLRLMRAQQVDLDAHSGRRLLEQVELPLVPVLVDMELAGVLIDRDLLADMSRRLTVRLGEIEEAVYAQAGLHFNIASPQQLAEVLFDRMGLAAPGARQTRTGRVSVAADVLESMQGTHPVVDLVLEHRQLSKLKGTYVDALPAIADPRTGRVHTSFNQTGAVSGRLSSQDPNLQNIPIRTDLGREVRRAFIVPDGWRLVAADYSQVELRIAAHLSGDPGLRAAFAAGEDIHRATAATVLGIPADSVTPDQRSFAKRVNFGLLYGMGARSLAEQAGIPMKEAQRFVDAYFAGFPSIRKYIETTKRQAREDGYVETLLGRRRYFPVLGVTTRDARTGLLQAAAEREAINHPMQGSAADIIKIAMVRIHDALRERGSRARLLLQVHDELVLEAPEDEAADVAALVKTLMEGAWPLDPPLKVDVGIGANWAEVK